MLCGAQGADMLHEADAFPPPSTTTTTSMPICLFVVQKYYRNENTVSSNDPLFGSQPQVASRARTPAAQLRTSQTYTDFIKRERQWSSHK